MAQSGCTPTGAVYDSTTKKIDQGQFDSALADVNHALSKFRTGNEEWAWRFRILKARILVSQSNCKDALAVLEGDLPPVLSSGDVAEQRKLYQAIAHRYCQEFPEAERDFDAAEKLVQPLASKFKCQFLIARGALEVDEKKYSAAETRYKSALAIARREGLAAAEARALGDLARLATSREYFDQAVDLNQEALKLSRSLDMQANTATILGNMAWSFLQLGDFDNALLYYQQAEEASEKTGLTGYAAYWLTGIADVYYANHDYQAAEETSKRALDIARKLDDRETITTSLNILSRNELATNRPDLAEQYCQEALKLENAGLDHFGTLRSTLLSAQIEASKQKPKQAEQLFLSVMQDSNADTPLRWEAQARLAKLHDDEGMPAMADKEYRRAIDTIEAARSSIDRDDLRLPFLSSGIEFYDDYIGFLLAHNRPEDALSVAELSRARTLEEGLGPRRKAATGTLRIGAAEQIAQRLTATVLFYWIGQQQSHLWVIAPTKTRYYKLPSASEVNSLVKSYRQAQAEGRDAFKTANDEGKKLFAMLVAPARQLIPPSSRVVVLPDASLYNLNFETLIVPDPQPHFWIEDVTLSTANSLTLLAASAMRSGPNHKNLLLVGDTIQASADFPALSQAPQEMSLVEKHFPVEQRAVLTKNKATPAAYLSSEPGRYSYLHFVTHGTASRTRPLESAVILSREPGSDTYKLYARDIVNHPLQAELVTISACNGSGTRTYSGEGLVGLSWAFLRAGAHNVIGALWEVSDVSTPRLMDRMYAELAEGKDPATALRAAKLSLLHSDNVFKKPFYWAPFQLYAGS